MINSLILHYKVLEKLGEGGMGIVYLAMDSKLERKVAIKFLPRHISNDSEEKERFKIEAKAAASMNHPNIATIYSIEETEEQTFIVMEYVEGKELKEIVKGESVNPLQTDEIINYAIQIAEGLQAAHRKGIVHRDIKSSNILVTNENKIKVMDFGLAQIKGVKYAAASESTAGTTPYMSPEQLKGEEIDQRTDVWSFGIVLYEMITGELPFTGEYDQAISYSIISEKEKPVSAFREDIPAKLISIVEACLAKEKEKRYNNSDEILEELQSINKMQELTAERDIINTNSNNKKKTFIISVSVIVFMIAAFSVWNFLINNKSDINSESISIKRIAVLPFTNINNNPDVDFLSFALADQIINSLAYVKDVLVRPSSAIRKYQNKVVDPAEVAQQLNVEYILSGSFQKELGKIRLNLELVDTRTNNLIWHEGIEEKYLNAFKIQDIASEKVVTGLKLEFTSGKTLIKPKDISNDPLAYEYFLRAVAYPVSNDGNFTAIELLKKSLQIDSLFSPAYSELGYRYHTLATYDLSEREKLKDAEIAYEKALSINGESLSALGNLSAIYTETGKTLKAVELIRRALKINPNKAEAHFWLGYNYRYTGLLDKSAFEMETALKLDPSNVRFRSIGVTYLYQNKLQKAFEALNLDKGSPYSTAFQGQIYLKQNKKDSACGIF